MKVAILNEKYAPYISGGAEKSLKILADGLAQRGLKPEVITLSPKSRYVADMVDDVRVHYLPLRNFYWPFDGKTRAHWKKWAFLLRDAVNVPMVTEVTDILGRMNADVLHTNNLFGLSTLIWQAEGSRLIPIVHTIRDHFLMCPHSTRHRHGKRCPMTCVGCKPFFAANRILSQNVDVVVGNSRYILREHLRYGYFPKATRRTVIYNASAISRSNPQASSDIGRARSVTFGFLGRLTPEKGIEEFLDATRELPPSGWRLMIAGGGIRDYVSDLKAKYAHPNISWLDWVAPETVYPNVDWVVVPSLWQEPLPRVILEAHSFGIPVLASRRGGIVEIVSHDRTGILFDPDEPGSLLGWLSQILSGNICAANYSAACLDASQLYEVDRLVDQYVEIYESVLGTRGSTKRPGTRSRGGERVFEAK